MMKRYSKQLINNPIFVFSFIIVIISAISCKRHSEEENTPKKLVNQLTGKLFHLPHYSKVLLGDSIIFEVPNIRNPNAKLKITTYINGDCQTCIDEIKAWNDFSQSVNKINNVNVYYYVFTSDIEHFRDNIYNKEIYKYPLLLVKNNDYLNKNNLPLDNKMYQTFLLDSNNKVILVGNPIYSEKLMELYKEEINERLD